MFRFHGLASYLKFDRQGVVELHPYLGCIVSSCGSVFKLKFVCYVLGFSFSFKIYTVGSGFLQSLEGTP